MSFKAMKFPYYLEMREKSANFTRLREYQGPIFLQVLIVRTIKEFRSSIYHQSYKNTILMRMVLMKVKASFHC